MIDSGHSNSGTKADHGDPLVALATAVRDMWLFGASTAENVLTQGRTDSASASLNPFVEQMLRAGSAFRDLTATNMNALAGLRKPEDGSNDMLALMARANLIAGMGGFRYWQKLAQIHAARQSNI